MKASMQLRTKLIAILLGLIGTLIAGVGFYYGVFEELGLEQLTLDFRFRYFNRDLKGSDEICIVAIDDASLAELGQWPWPRTYLASMIDVINQLEGREILIDLIFSTPKSSCNANEAKDSNAVDTFANQSQDDILASACSEQGKVILACYFSPGSFSQKMFEMLVADFSLSPQTLAKKMSLPLDKIRTQFTTVRKLAARELMSRVLLKQTQLDKFQAIKDVIGPNWITKTDQREELERAYEFLQAYIFLRYKSGSDGWMIDQEQLPASIWDLSRAAGMELPIAKLASSCGDFGFVNFSPDQDGKVRDVPLLSSYDGVIFRQFALAAISREWQIKPDSISIYPDRIDFESAKSDASGTANENAFFTSGESNKNLTIPLTREGKLIINWYAPDRNDWSKSFATVSARGLLKIAFNQQSLIKNQELLNNAMTIAVKNFLPGSALRYEKLREKAAILEHSINGSFWDDDLAGVATVKKLSATQPTTLPATTIEEDLRENLKRVQNDIEIIEDEVKAQLDWLYGQTSDLSAVDQLSIENRLISDLWRCLLRPGEVQKMNDELRQTIDRQIADAKKFFKNRYVLIGYTGSTTADFVPTPVFNRCPGVFVHATILNQLKQRAFLTASDRNTDLLMILIVGTILSILTAQRSAFEGLLWMLFFLFGFVVFSSIVIFGRLHVLSSMIGPMCAIVLSWLLVSFYRQITEGRARRLFASRLGQYTSPALVKRITENPERLSLRPEQVQVSCFFSDMVSFTPISEKLGADKTVQLLNIYFEHMSEVLHSYESFINKFYGDGIFAFFNPPLNPQKDHARRACLAAIESQSLTVHIEKHLGKMKIELGRPLELRIGLSTGKAVIGDCGSARKFDYTCLGDTVNLASRLEAANKIFGTRILIDKKTYLNMGEDLLARFLGTIRVTGIAKSVEVYELIGYADQHQDKLEFVTLFENMVDAYRGQNFQLMADLLGQLTALRPNDRSIKIYRAALNKIAEQGGQVIGDGVIDIEIK